MRKLIFLFTALSLTACTTPVTTLKNDETGQVTRCGGNVAYAGVLYPFMRAADSKCVDDYKGQGFKIINSEDSGTTQATNKPAN